MNKTKQRKSKLTHVSEIEPLKSLISKKYTKRPAGEFKTTSVTIRVEQYEFIKENNINLSAVVQDALMKIVKARGEK